MQGNFNNIREPLKTGVKSKNGQGVPDSRKADEVRLYALRGGLKKQAVCYTHFHSNEVFRCDHYITFLSAMSTGKAMFHNSYVTPSIIRTSTRFLYNFGKCVLFTVPWAK